MTVNIHVHVPAWDITQHSVVVKRMTNVSMLRGGEGRGGEGEGWGEGEGGGRGEGENKQRLA